VMMPSRKASSFEMVEPELALEVFVHALGSPTLLDEVHEVLHRKIVRQGGEMELGGLGLVVAPLHQQPYRLTVIAIGAFIGNDDTAHGEARRKRVLGSLAPSDAAEASASELRREVTHAHGSGASLAVCIELKNTGRNLG